MPLTVWAALALAISYLVVCPRPEGWIRSIWKTLPVALLALAVWQNGGPNLLGLALALSAIGDFALSRRGNHAFLAGMGAFALAHLVYIALFFRLILVGSRPPDVLHAVLSGLILGAALSCKRWLVPYAGALKLPVIAYIVILTTMSILAFWVPIQFWPVQLGAALFVLSDFVLSLTIFRLGDKRPWRRFASIVVWSSYFLAQCFLAWGLFLAL